MRHPARRFVRGAGRGLLSPMCLRAFNDLLPCTVHRYPFGATLSVCQAMVEPTCAGPTHGPPKRARWSGCCIVFGLRNGTALSAPEGCAVHMTCLQSLFCHLYAASPLTPTLVHAHYAMTVWAVRRLMLPVLCICECLILTQFHGT